MSLQQNIWNSENLIKTLRGEGVVVMPTDTLYGIVGSALNERTVKRIYNTKKRNSDKPCIVLIGDVNELKKFGIFLMPEQEKEVEKHKEPTSFILDCEDEKLAYLHRGTNSLAFRLPAQKGLRNLLKQTGPLVAPSANLEGLLPATNITEAKKYFRNSVDLYVDGGEIKGKASKIIKLNKDGSTSIFRV